MKSYERPRYCPTSGAARSHRLFSVISWKMRCQLSLSAAITIPRNSRRLVDVLKIVGLRMRSRSASERPWWWRLEDSSGNTVEASEHKDQRFGSQADAESWVGEVYAELAEAGVDAVTLFEHDRQVYGPMSLHP